MCKQNRTYMVMAKFKLEHTDNLKFYFYFVYEPCLLDVWLCMLLLYALTVLLTDVSNPNTGSIGDDPGKWLFTFIIYVCCLLL
jgi:hypothetical protein